MITDEEFLRYGIAIDEIYLPLCENDLDVVHKIKYEMYIDKTNPQVLQRIGEETTGLEYSLNDEEYNLLIENRKYAIGQIGLLNQV